MCERVSERVTVPHNNLTSSLLSSSSSFHRYVGQEPTLFSGSVSDNIARGRAVVSESHLTLQEVMHRQNNGNLLAFLPRKMTGIKATTTATNTATGNTSTTAPSSNETKTDGDLECVRMEGGYNAAGELTY